jgi:hypothetical protein
VSYLRGEFYIWSSDTRTHFWVAAGDDGWRESVWAEHRAAEAKPDSGGPSGVGVPQHIADAYAVMRFAELVDRHELGRAIDRALELGRGNVGCDSLQRHAGLLRMAFPHTLKRVELASKSRIESVEHLAERFFREVIVDYEYPECLVTDESDLYDFADLSGDRDTEVAAMLDRFRAHYMLDPRPHNTTNIVCLLEFLAASGVAE